MKSLSRVRLFATPWTYQAPPSMRFSRQEYWSGLPFPSPRDLPDPGIEPRSPALQADALTSEPPGKPSEVTSRVQLFVTPWTVDNQPPPMESPWDFPGKSTGVGCHFLLQMIFPSQGSNPGLLHCRQMLYCLRHQERHSIYPEETKIERDSCIMLKQYSISVVYNLNLKHDQIPLIE